MAPKRAARAARPVVPIPRPVVPKNAAIKFKPKFDATMTAANYNAQIDESLQKDLDLILNELPGICGMDALPIKANSTKVKSGHQSPFKASEAKNALDSTGYYDFGGNFLWGKTLHRLDVKIPVHNAQIDD